MAFNFLHSESDFFNSVYTSSSQNMAPKCSVVSVHLSFGCVPLKLNHLCTSERSNRVCETVVNAVLFSPIHPSVSLVSTTCRSHVWLLTVMIRLVTYTMLRTVLSTVFLLILRHMQWGIFQGEYISTERLICLHTVCEEHTQNSALTLTQNHKCALMKLEKQARPDHAGRGISHGDTWTSFYW